MTTSRKRVGVIGAGVSGVSAAAYLIKYGLDVIVFERSSVAGGIWVYDERTPPEPTYPSLKPSTADLTAPLETLFNESGESKLERNIENGTKVAVNHSPPTPCYEGLSNNVPTTLMELKLNSWKPNTAPIVKHNFIAEYLQDTAFKTGVDAVTKFNTRVEKTTKIGQKWKVKTTTLDVKNPSNPTLQRNTWEFDSLVIASGHYHAPLVPDIPGLKEWKKAFPNRVQHSKGYKTSKGFENQTVLFIGAGVSSMDIASELGPVAKKVYQSSRGGAYDLSAAMLPENGSQIAGIVSFTLPKDLKSPGSVALTTGEVLNDIDRIIIATGYHCAFPFLSELHSDNVEPQNANETALVTDGKQVHNLHKDIFYIPDPSLAFIGVPYYVATFTLFEFQAIAIAATFAGKAVLPTQEEMRDEYNARVAAKGYGRNFHSLKDQDASYANELLNWINADLEKIGEKTWEGHTKEWQINREAFGLTLRAKYGRNIDAGVGSTVGVGSGEKGVSGVVLTELVV